MSRSLPWNGRALAALACAATLGLAPVASADTCTGLSLTALTPTAVGTTPVAVAVGDFNRDGLMDVVAANSGSNNISVLLGNGAGGFTEEAGSPILTGGSPSDIAAGDLDRDGYLDLVVTLGAQIKVMRRLPAGGFDNTSIPLGLLSAPSRIYLVDLTRDARLDLVVVSNAGNSVTAYEGNGLTFPNTLSTIDVSLPGPPERPVAAAIGDFNRDGRTDLAVAFESSNDVNLYFGNGMPSGSFAWAAGPSITLVGVTVPRDIAAGDIDRDGWPDLVTANIVSGDASVLRNVGGGALSQVVPSLPIGAMPIRLTLADLNQDGVLDLAALDDSPTPRLASFEGFKTGPPWFASAAAAAPFPPGAALRGLAVGRFTADGRLDLVTALSGPGQAAVVQNQSGTPCARSSFALAPRSYLVGDRPVSSAAADFDHDGRQDLVVATGNDKYIRILRNVSGGFVTGTQVGPLSIAPRGVASADINVDGHLDVVVAQGDVGAGQVQVYLGDGAGGLTPAPGGVQPAGFNTSALVIGDFNGDGAPDVAATAEGSGVVYVFLGNGAGGLAAGTPTVVGSSPHALVAGFFDAGTTLDLAVANLLSNNVSILYGNGDGTLVTGPVLGVATNPQGIAAADLDGNGHLDIVTADNGAARVSVILRDGAGAFLPAVGYGVGTNPTAVALLDLVNGDGKAEIAVTTAAGSGAQMLSVLTNNGSGVFGAQTDHPVRNSPQAITPIDADGDGLVDLAIPCSISDAVVVLANRSPGPPLFSAAPRALVHAKPRAAAAGDFDGDGDLDLAVANSVDNTVSLLNGDGAGGLSEYATAAAAGAEAVVAADFNRDGKLDLAVSAPGAPSVVILFGTGGGAFAPQTAVTDVGLTNPDDMAVGDFDRDGDLDIAVCNKAATGTVFILRNNGAGVFTVVTGPTVGNKPTAIVAADFDRDGDLDLAVANDDSDNVMILANSGGSFTVVQTLLLAGGETSPVSLAAADFDANGLVDLAAASILFDRIHVYRNTGASFVTTPLTYDAPALLQSVTAADVNLDGRPDLVVTAAGLSVFRGRGGLDFDPPETVVARHTPVAAVVADFSRDGRPDVVVVNQDSNDLTILSSSACSAQHLEASLISNACDLAAPFLIDATVTAFDDGGNAAMCAVGSVSPSIVPPTGGAVLGGPSSLPFTAGLGVASFTGANGLTIDLPGRYRLQFQTAGLAPVKTGSLSLVEAGTTQILGPGSVCPGAMGVYSTNQIFDTYTWTITPSGPPLPQYTPSVTLSGPPLAGSYTLSLVGRNECTTAVNRSIYFGNLASVSLQLQGVSSVCVDCIGGSAKAVELGGGMPTSWQWGYRTVSSIGSITPLAGETADTYTLKGASFPGPGTYYVVVTTTPTCGSPTVSNEWPVTVVAGVPSGEVLYLAASSRGTAANGQNNLLWVNTTAPLEIRVRWNKAPNGTINCLPPDSLTSPANNPPATDEISILSPTANAKDSYLHSGLVLDTAYCYSVFVRTGAGWSGGRTVKARPFDSTAGPVKWAYATGGTAVAPPTVSGEGILAMSNDRTVHALTRGSAGGDWPAAWVPTELVGVAHSRSPVVPFPLQLNGADNVLFVADDSPTGVLHAINARSGVAVWTDKPQGKPVTGAPGGMFMQFGGMRDLLVVGTRDTVNNELRGLSVAAGTLLEAYAGAGSGGLIGPISGTPAIDYATNRVYFASRQQAGGDTLWCVEILPTGPPVFSYAWSRNLGDITGSPVLKGGRVYVGTEAGTIYSVNASTGPLAGDISDDHVYTPAPADGPVKGFLFPDRRNDDLIFATDTTVWSISDDGPAMSRNWQWTTAGLNPSVVLYWPQTNFVYVGSKNGELYELDFTSANTSTPPTSKLQVLGGGFGQIGAPSLDIGVTPKLLLVGSEPGVVYGVEVPFP